MIFTVTGHHDEGIIRMHSLTKLLSYYTANTHVRIYTLLEALLYSRKFSRDKIFAVDLTSMHENFICKLGVLAILLHDSGQHP